MEEINVELLENSLIYHGSQLNRFFEEQFGDEFKNIKCKGIDYHPHHQKSKDFSLLDRSRKIRLHQFIAKKAKYLFSKPLDTEVRKAGFDKNAEDYYGIVPPIELFMEISNADRKIHFFKMVKIGDFVVGSVHHYSLNKLVVKILAFDGGKNMEIWDLGLKGIVPGDLLLLPVDGQNRNAYQQNDLVRCEIIHIEPETEKLTLSLIPQYSSVDIQHQLKLGLISILEMPLAYRRSKEAKGDNYNSMLESSFGFLNPGSCSYLMQVFELDQMDREAASLLTCLQGEFKEIAFADHLRKIQNEKWAFHSVADGITFFKKGNVTEAFQCLNQALKFDPDNVEALVARGALYANGGSFKKAVEDFEQALKVNPKHQNASKYLAETLVAIGRSYEDGNKIDEALEMYTKCLEWMPEHEEALESIKYLQKKSKEIDNEELLIPLGLLTRRKREMGNKLTQLIKDHNGKKKEKRRKKRRHSSSSSSSSSTSYVTSSTSSISSDSSDDSEASHVKKKKRSSNKIKEHKEKSLSPLSKKMALFEKDTSLNYQKNIHPVNTIREISSCFSNQPAPSGILPLHSRYPNINNGISPNFMYPAPVPAPVPPPQKSQMNTDFEMKVQTFLNQANIKEERKKNEKEKKEKNREEKKKRKKEKKEKRSKEEKRKEKHKKLARKHDDFGKKKNMLDIDEDLLNSDSKFYKKLKKDSQALGGEDFLDDLPNLQMLEARLSAYYARFEEKQKKRNKKEEDKKDKKRKKRSRSVSSSFSDSSMASSSSSGSSSDEEAAKKKSKKKSRGRKQTLSQDKVQEKCQMDESKIIPEEIAFREDRPDEENNWNTFVKEKNEAKIPSLQDYNDNQKVQLPEKNVSNTNRSTDDYIDEFSTDKYRSLEVDNIVNADYTQIMTSSTPASLFPKDDEKHEKAAQLSHGYFVRDVKKSQSPVASRSRSRSKTRSRSYSQSRSHSYSNSRTRSRSRSRSRSLVRRYRPRPYNRRPDPRFRGRPFRQRGRGRYQRKFVPRGRYYYSHYSRFDSRSRSRSRSRSYTRRSRSLSKSRSRSKSFSKSPIREQPMRNRFKDNKYLDTRMSNAGNMANDRDIGQKR